MRRTIKQDLSEQETVMKSSTFWDITPYSLLKAGDEQLATYFHADFLLCLFFELEEGGNMFLRKMV
jgi:hypothetical protein